MLVRNIFTLSALLLSPAIAGRLDKVARNKGFHPNALRDLEARAELSRRGAGSKAQTERKYYNDESAKYFVESLPDIPHALMTEMYSGLIPIEESNPDRALFFVFQPRVSGDPVDEITFWTNGGPGCSSLESFLQETGLIQWTWGQCAPQINPYSWRGSGQVQIHRRLSSPFYSLFGKVEQPVGTGFSVGKRNATNEEDIAADVVGFLKNFEKIFGIQNHQIYITGESYAGRYVPYIADAMLQQNDECYFNVSGALMYDPCIGQFETQDAMYTYDFISENNNILGFNDSFLQEMDSRDKECGYKDFKEKYMRFPPSGMQPALDLPSEKCDLWNIAYDAAYGPNPCFNVYQPTYNCPLLSDPLGYPTDLQYSYPGLPVYFNRTDVKRAMHAPMDVEWLECAPHPVFFGDGGPEGYDDVSPDPIQEVLPRVIEATNRVLVANGKLDMDVLTGATLLAIQNMTFNGMMGFQSKPSTPIDIKLPDKGFQHLFKEQGFGPLDAHQGIMGVQHYERGLMFAETYLSGHMEPQFQPRSAYRHLQWMLGRIEEL